MKNGQIEINMKKKIDCIKLTNKYESTHKVCDLGTNFIPLMGKMLSKLYFFTIFVEFHN